MKSAIQHDNNDEAKIASVLELSLCIPAPLQVGSSVLLFPDSFGSVCSETPSLGYWWCLQWRSVKYVLLISLLQAFAWYSVASAHDRPTIDIDLLQFYSFVGELLYGCMRELENCGAWVLMIHNCVCSVFLILTYTCLRINRTWHGFTQAEVFNNMVMW